MPLTKRRNTDILLGAFVCFGVLLLVFSIFLIGKENRLFDRSARINVYFNDVVGLSVEADVMLAGVLVGHVDQIGLPVLKGSDAKTAGKIKVVLRIPQDKLPWLRADSVARIDSKGLLGDKIINVTLGNPETPSVPEGGQLLSVESLDFNNALVKAESVLTHVTGAVEAARSFIEGFVSKGGDTALANAAHSTQNLVGEIESGDGLLHRMIYSKEAGTNFEEALAGLDKLFKNSDQTVANLNDIIQSTKEGQGTLGRLLNDPSIYDDLKLILSHVERNRILKTLIRFSLSQKEKRQDSKE